MPISDLCESNVVTISQDDSIQQAAKLMADKNVGSIVVTEKNSKNEPVGIITDRDITINVVAKNKDLENTKVSEIMSSDLLTLRCNLGLKEAIEKMQEKGVRRAPIMKDDQICGIAAIDDLMVLIANELNALSKLVQKQID